MDKNTSKLTYKSLFNLIFNDYLADKKWLYSFYLFLMIFSISAVHLELFIIATLADKLIAYDGDFKTVIEYGLYFVAFGGVFAILFIIAKLGTIKIGRKATYKFKENTLNKLSSFSLNWHQKANSGNTISKVNNGITNLSLINIAFRNRFIVQLVGVITISASFLFVNLYIFLIVVIFAILSYIVFFSVTKRLKVLQDQMNQLSEKSNGRFFEIYNNITLLKTTDSEKQMHKYLLDSEQKILDLRLKMIALRRFKEVSKTALSYTFSFIMILLLSYLVINNLLSTALFIVYFGFFTRIRNLITNSFTLFEDIELHRVGIERMMPILNQKPIKIFGDQKYPHNWETIEFKNVSFHYEGEKSGGLDSINFTINKGEKIGIVGGSGSGKSTLIKILSGLHKINSGSINVISNDLKINYYDLDFSEIVKKQSVIMQETETFNYSIKDNITLHRDISDKDFQKAIKISQLQSVIDFLPKGVETKIGEKGFKLSGGQKQRIGIARAICQNTDIILMDEATSSLDGDIEKKIQDGINSELNDKTLVIVAHRLTTLKGVDKIIVMDQGKIVETGGFEDLTQDSKSIFYKMWNRK